MIKEEYSPFKIVHHQEKLDKLKNGIQTVPIQIQLVPTNICNNNCSFCAYRMEAAISNQLFHECNFLSKEKIFEIIDDSVKMGIKSIHFTGGGEPLMHPDIYDIFKYTIDNGLNIGLSTNGVLLDKNNVLELLIKHASWIRISVDANEEKTYLSMRKTSKKSFIRVIKNIKRLIELKNSYKSNCVVGVGHVMNKENWKEVYDAAKQFKNLKVDNFRISGVLSCEGIDYFKSFINEGKELAIKCESLNDNNFKVFNLFNDRLIDNFIGAQDYEICHVKNLIVYIGADYNVYICCTLAYNKLGIIGSIKNQSFKSFWESDKKIELFKKHKAYKTCKFPCFYRGKNEFIDYLIKKDPKHVNFI